MKSILTFLMFALFLAAPAFGEDPLKAAPKMYTLLFENDDVRVMKVHFKPGEKIAKHSHPNHFVVVTHPGKLRIYKEDGTSTDAELKTNEVMWINAETHWAENIGKTDVELIVNEMKGTNGAHPVG